MKVYYGSDVGVKKPKIIVSRRYLDFGNGFYTTMNKEQARTWAIKQKKRKRTEECYVSTYDFNFEQAKLNLKIINFNEASKELLDFVLANRIGKCQEIYDIVIGPVADDGVYEIVKLYESGVYDLNDTLKRLKLQKHYNQILFHTEKSLTYVKFIEMEEIK